MRCAALVLLGIARRARSALSLTVSVKGSWPARFLLLAACLFVQGFCTEHIRRTGWAVSFLILVVDVTRSCTAITLRNTLWICVAVVCHVRVCFARCARPKRRLAGSVVV